MSSIPMPQDGQAVKLRFHLLEAQIADHCNLRCRCCSHHSPYLAPNFYSLERFKQDVRALSGVSESGELRLVGGEPLLHPDVDEFLFVAKESGVAKRYTVFTNGILLHRMTDRFFELVDHIHLSAYPVTSPRHDDFERLLLDRARRFNVEFYIGKADTFYDIETARLPEEVAQRSYDGCKRRLDFPMIHAGKFYKCMRPPTTGEFLRNRGACQPLTDFASVDGVSLDSPDLYESLVSYMQDKVALQSCSYCLLGFLHGYYESEDDTAYDRIKRSLLTNPKLREFVRSTPAVSHLFRILDPVLSPRRSGSEIPVPLRKHENMSRQECAPRVITDR